MPFNWIVYWLNVHVCDHLSCFQASSGLLYEWMTRLELCASQINWQLVPQSTKLCVLDLCTLCVAFPIGFNAILCINCAPKKSSKTMKKCEKCEKYKGLEKHYDQCWTKNRNLWPLINNHLETIQAQTACQPTELSTCIITYNYEICAPFVRHFTLVLMQFCVPKKVSKTHEKCEKYKELERHLD